MRSSHGSTGDGVSATVVPGGENGDTRSKDVNDGTVVGERSEAVRAVGGTDGVDCRLGCRRGVASISTIVTGSDGHEDTSADCVGRGSVDGSGARSTQRHVGNSTVGAAAGFGVVGDEVDTGNDTRVGARTTGIEDLDSVKLGLLGHTVGLGSDRTSAVGTVTVSVRVLTITSIVGEEGSTALKLGVGSVDASVNDIGASTSTSSGVVDVRAGTRLLVGDTSKAPCGRRLGCVGLLLEVRLAKVSLDDSILLNVVDLGYVSTEDDALEAL